ncbi:peptidoglycan editing factor PgeF [Oscillospiraceae bacterium WX1]
MTSSLLTVTHAFTTRGGGVSRGIHASLNLGQNVGDDPTAVRENYQLLAASLGLPAGGFVFSRQVHGAEVRLVTKEDRVDVFQPVPFEADGLVTAAINVPLVIFTADCVPMLLFDPQAHAVGAVHAGWRGTVADIAGAAVRKMAACFGTHPKNLRAAIGPCISQCCFETGKDVTAAVSALIGAAASNFIRADDSTFNVDLKGINTFLLSRAGLKAENIDVSPECTACSNTKYWSHRVTKGQRGSQATVIMLKGSAH